MKIAFIFVNPSHLSALRRSWCASITEKLCLIVQLPTNPLQCLQGQHPVCLILGCYLDLPTPCTSYILFFLCSDLPQNLQKFPSKPPTVVITTSQPPLRCCAFNTFCCNTLGSCAPRTKFSATAPVRSCSWRHLPGKGKAPKVFFVADFEVENKHDDDRYQCIMKVELCIAFHHFPCGEPYPLASPHVQRPTSQALHGQILATA